MFWILMASLALAADVIPAADHLECSEVEGEMTCWPAQSEHSLRDMCATKHGSDIDKSLHVHVVPAEATAMRESAPWSGQRQSVASTQVDEAEQPLAIASARPLPTRRPTTTTVRVSARGGTYQQPARRPPGVYVDSVYVRSAPAYPVGSYAVTPQLAQEAVTASAVSDFRASQDWISGVRAENQSYQNQAAQARARAQKAETARKAEEARRVAAQARAAELDSDLGTALNAGGELVEENEILRKENARLRAAQDNPDSEE